MSEEMPERIIVSKTITYTVANIIQQIRDDNRDIHGEMNVTIDDVLEVIEGYALDDFSCGWGHKTVLKELLFTDENGNEY